jgi:hypothetical protein
MMKRVWKPIGVGGLRLYQVVLHYQVKGRQKEYRQYYIVAADSPRDAAKLVEDIKKEAMDGNGEIVYWHVRGEALNVLQPAEWWDHGVPDGYCNKCHEWTLRVISGKLFCTRSEAH